MINLKSETMGFLDSHRKVIRAAEVIRLGLDDDGGGLPLPKILCKTNDHAGAWLAKLDFEYDNGYGGQEIDGTIWFTDGTWATRGEYDGSEWWELRQCPELPTYLA